MYNFDAKKVKDECVEWIKNWFEENGKGCVATIGISGGKDSSVVAALCVEALGKDRVLGVMMPQGTQAHSETCDLLIRHLGIRSMTCNIEDSVNALLKEIGSAVGVVSEQTKINLPARVRMSVLAGVSQSVNGRFSCNCNLSEDWIGYSTIFGDNVGNFMPISNLTATEVIAIGRELGLPDKIINEIPSDDLCGKTDEENFGFTYEELDRYIREGVIDNVEVKDKIDTLHKNNLFKLQPISSFMPSIQNK